MFPFISRVHQFTEVEELTLQDIKKGGTDLEDTSPYDMTGKTENV